MNKEFIREYKMRCAAVRFNGSTPTESMSGATFSDDEIAEIDHAAKCDDGCERCTAFYKTIGY